MVAAATPRGRRRGKSGLHRAGCQITSGGGDPRDSATEIYRPLHLQQVRVEWRGTCKPHPKQDQTESIWRPVSFRVGCLMLLATVVLDR